MAFINVRKFTKILNIFYQNQYILIYIYIYKTRKQDLKYD